MTSIDLKVIKFNGDIFQENLVKIRKTGNLTYNSFYDESLYKNMETIIINVPKLHLSQSKLLNDLMNNNEELIDLSNIIFDINIYKMIEYYEKIYDDIDDEYLDDLNRNMEKIITFKYSDEILNIRLLYKLYSDAKYLICNTFIDQIGRVTMDLFQKKVKDEDNLENVITQLGLFSDGIQIQERLEINEGELNESTIALYNKIFNQIIQ